LNLYFNDFWAGATLLILQVVLWITKLVFSSKMIYLSL